MEVQNKLEKIIAFADEAHGTQTRKYSDDRYIVHPLRVMEMVKEYKSELPVLAAAILHDVLEDTTITSAQLGSFLESVMNKDDASTTLKLVVELTDVYVKESFPNMNRRSRKQKEAERLAKVSADAQTIKYADIYDNTDITFQDVSFASVYLREAKTLLEAMVDGNFVLRERALLQVNKCLQAVAKNVVD